MRELALDFCRKLALYDSELHRLSLLATLHDIGKTNINAKTLNKTGKSTQKEWKMVKGHLEHCYKIAISSEEFAVVADEIFIYHER